MVLPELATLLAIADRPGTLAYYADFPAAWVEARRMPACNPAVFLTKNWVLGVGFRLVTVIKAGIRKAAFVGSEELKLAVAKGQALLLGRPDVSEPARCA